MKLIIDISKGMLEAIKDGYWCGSHKLELAIRNGIPYEERPQGEWIKEDEVHSKCSLCGFKYADYRILFDFCPNCGADMRVKDELNNELNELKEAEG